MTLEKMLERIPEGVWWSAAGLYGQWTSEGCPWWGPSEEGRLLGIYPFSTNLSRSANVAHRARESYRRFGE